MKQFLPKLLLIICLLLTFFVVPQRISAQVATATPTPDATSGLPSSTTGLAEGDWYKDPEVTFVGKNAARSGKLLDWTLKNYDWETVTDGTRNPLEPFWQTIETIVFALFGFFIIVSAFIFIVTRGKSVTVRKFIPRFIIVAVCIALSFAVVQGFYQIGDLIQGFFLKAPDGGKAFCSAFTDGSCIQQKHLLYVGWDYETFDGLRRFGEKFAESGFITLLLTKLTALTYYVMVGILIVRKIILWFFLIVSPIFPVLLLYYPLRNTAKIWTGEFFRWLLYGPLFAVFLAGLVSIWQQYIPMNFDFAKAQAGSDMYPTGVNILLGGPGQNVYFNADTGLGNNLNYPDTFAQYIVSLIMLWIVIILPFILLQIFLDYMNKFAWGESAIYKQIVNTATGFHKTPPAGSPLPTGPPTSPAGAGLARSLPFGRKFSIPKQEVTQMPAQTMNSIPVMQSNQVTSQIAQMTNLSVPTMRDIARFETSLRSTNTEQKQEVTQLRERLQQIANPASSQQFKEMRDKLVQESQKGNIYATTILSAANSATNISSSTAVTNQMQQFLEQVANPSTVTSAVERDSMVQLRDSLVKESQQGNHLATTILISAKNVAIATTAPEAKAEEVKKVADEVAKAKTSGNPVASKVSKAIAQKAQAATPAGFPTANRVQQVSLDDYEAVKKMWHENYQNMDVPLSLTGEKTSRKQWVEGDVSKISETIALLTSTDEEKVKEGMQQVSDILPFLLIGGFSQTEIIAYLKAKQEAAKAVSEELAASTEDEDTLAGTAKRHTEAQQTMTMSAEAATPVEIPSPITQVVQSTELPVSQIRHESVSPQTSPVVVKQVVSTAKQEAANILSLVNITLPTLREIAKFDANKGRDLRQNEDTVHVHETLKNILHADQAPTGDRFKLLKDRLVTESKKGNELATLILSAAASTETIQAKGLDQESLRMERVLFHLANPANTLTAQEQQQMLSLREKLLTESQKKNELAVQILATAASLDQTQLHGISHLLEQIAAAQEGKADSTQEMLVLKKRLEAESNNGNLLASTVLSVAQALANKKLSESDKLAVIHLLKEELRTENKKGNKLAGTILSEIEKTEQRADEIAQLEGILTKIVNPASVVLPADRTKYEQLKNQLLSAKQNGNKLAESILSAQNVLIQPKVNNTFFDGILETVHTELLSQNLKGDPFAVSLLSDLKGETDNRKVLVIDDLLKKLGEPKNIILASEQKHIAALKEMLTFESQKDNTVAMSILSAAQIARDTGPAVYESRKVYEQLTNQGNADNPVIAPMHAAVEVLFSTEKMLMQLNEVLTGLQNPEAVIDQLEKERMTSLTKQLTDYQKTGNSTASSVGITLEKLRTITDPEQREKVIASFHEKLQEQKEAGDVFAMIFLSQIKRSLSEKELRHLSEILRHIADPSRIPMDDERLHFEQMRKELLAQKEQKNTFAISVLTVADVLTAKEKVLSASDTDAITLLLRKRLQQESENGNDIATNILSAVSLKEEDNAVAKIRTEILTAKEKGDPVATLLLTVLDDAKKPAIIGTHVFPEANRIQQVNLDDYESVKKIWTENYQTQIPPLTKDGKQMNRRLWLQSDQLEIEETMAHLASSDEKERTLGMEQVSSILPFLLIGGFSQTEIIAYLKAKEEAVKFVLSGLREEDEEDDTTLTRKSNTEATQGPLVQTEHAVVPLNNTFVSASPETTYQELHLSLPKLHDLVRYELSFAQADKDVHAEPDKLAQILQSIAFPEKLQSPEDRSHYQAIKDKLIADQQKGDAIAAAILSAADSLSLNKQTQQTVSPAAIDLVLTQLADAKASGTIGKLKDALLAQSRKGSMLATTFINTANTYQHTKAAPPDTARVATVFKELQNPDQIVDEYEREEVRRVKGLVEKGEREGSILAKTVVTTMQRSDSSPEVQKVRDWIMQADKVGDPLAKALSGLINLVPHPEVLLILNQMKAAELKNDPILPDLLAVFTAANAEKNEPEKNTGLSLVFPPTNRMQQVADDEYEKVKKLWTDSYRMQPVPQHIPNSSREVWLQEEQKKAAALVTLLTSGNPEHLQKGMLQLSSLLPYILIGGFSQSEVVSYLKARQEAAITVEREEKKKALK